MVITKNSIVRDLASGELYEITEVSGTLLIGRSVNNPRIHSVPLLRNEVELIIDEATDMFDVLFKGDE